MRGAAKMGWRDGEIVQAFDGRRDRVLVRS